MIDQFSVSLMTALVVLMGGILFLFDTLLRRPEVSGRLWATGFLSAVLTTIFYLLWAADPASVWPVVCGNAFSVFGTGAMWLGCRAYNRRGVLVPGGIVALAAVAVATATGVEFALGGDDWSGSVAMFIALLGLAGAASIECFRGDLGATRTALPLGIVFGIQSAFYAARVVVVTLDGYGGFFHTWLGTFSTSLLTVILAVTALVTVSVLRAGRVGLRGSVAGRLEGEDAEEILSAEVFQLTLRSQVRRAAVRNDLLAVSVIELDGLEYIATAFGLDVGDEVVTIWRRTMTDSAPTLALLGEVGSERIGMITVVPSAAEARRQAMALYRSLFESLGTVEGGVLPAIGIGVALSDVTGYDAERLRELALSTAERASSGVASAVLLAEENA
ncbi:diguanylate cyclase domain-containing protein [Microbacterium radiodurans]|uniref:Diguanylate cyclase n=1 Tax=Microbacterium radiodurans TaxID=661398 RepID=A0A5J5IVR8_9MICO|nr:diguanylate cyclase [Microbacterium radiodurans]KAA9087142.1 diguanylate cyclase [Microbacterium radiodurans]